MGDPVHKAVGKRAVEEVFLTMAPGLDARRAAGEGVTRYLALGPRAILIDEISSVDAVGIVCSATVREQCAYVRGHSVSAVALLEYLAQTVGVLVGYHEVESGGQAPIGLLVGCARAWLVVDRVQVGERLTLEAKRTWGRRDFGTFEGLARIDGREVAAASLTVARPDQAWVEQWKSQRS